MGRIIIDYRTPEYIHRWETLTDANKQNGAYNYSKELVEKLKAWKRLKELGFRFIGKTCEYKSDKHFGSVFFEISGEILDVYKDNVDFYDDLDLLFG